MNNNRTTMTGNFQKNFLNFQKKIQHDLLVIQGNQNKERIILKNKLNKLQNSIKVLNNKQIRNNSPKPLNYSPKPSNNSPKPLNNSQNNTNNSQNT